MIQCCSPSQTPFAICDYIGPICGKNSVSFLCILRLIAAKHFGFPFCECIDPICGKKFRISSTFVVQPVNFYGCLAARFFDGPSKSPMKRHRTIFKSRFPLIFARGLRLQHANSSTFADLLTGLRVQQGSHMEPQMARLETDHKTYSSYKSHRLPSLLPPAARDFECQRVTHGEFRLAGSVPNQCTASAGLPAADERFWLPAFEPIGNWREGFASGKGRQADRVGTREPTRHDGASPQRADCFARSASLLWAPFLQDLGSQPEAATTQEMKRSVRRIRQIDGWLTDT